MTLTGRARALAVLAAASMAAGCGDARPSPAGWSDDDRTLYALGAVIARRVKRFDASRDELALIKDGLRAGVKGAPPVASPEEYSRQLDDITNSRKPRVEAAWQQENQAVLAEAARAPGATRAASGVVTQILEQGSGPAPKPGDRVRANYSGRLVDGRLFDRGKGREFAPNQAIACMREAIAGMRVGGRLRFTAPPSAAFGEAGEPPRVPPHAVVTYEVELLGIVTSGNL